MSGNATHRQPSYGISSPVTNALLAQNFLPDKLPRLRKVARNKTNLESSICSASKCLQTGKRF
jgi:hypothetical protein